ncbi:MAG TPA: hypothetical protein VN810_01370 [Terriglobales bacterium]|nr:hypothetical protein [Terriglobales bacterium]
MQIDLNSEELNLLVELLRRDYQELREEIYKTEDYRFKTDLRAKEKLIESLLQKVEPAGAVKSA